MDHGFQRLSAPVVLGRCSRSQSSQRGAAPRSSSNLDREDWDKRYRDSAFVWSVDPNQFVVAETANLEPGRALDLAAGEGRNAIWLAEQGWKVTAVDFSDVAIAKGRRMAQHRGVRVTWRVADLVAYAPSAGAYALVLVCYLQLPVDERRAILAQATRAVAPGGTFLWIAHDVSNLEQGVGGPRDPAVLCSPKDIVEGLSGFEVLKAEVARRSVEPARSATAPETVAALDTLVRAVRRPAR